MLIKENISVFKMCMAVAGAQNTIAFHIMAKRIGVFINTGSLILLLGMTTDA